MSLNPFREDALLGLPAEENLHLSGLWGHSEGAGEARVVRLAPVTVEIRECGFERYT